LVFGLLFFPLSAKLGSLYLYQNVTLGTLAHFSSLTTDSLLNRHNLPIVQKYR
jgi:hypothetical protein